MSNRKVYISVISMYIMINKESKQTKKTETKGLYNTIPSKDMTKGLITTRKDLSYWEKQDLKRKKGIKHFSNKLNKWVL